MRKNLVISIIMFVVVAIVIGGTWILLSGGGQGMAADSPGESPGTQRAATERIADLRAQPGWEEPDWSNVEAAAEGGFRAIMEVVHCVDFWHRGETPEVILVCDANGVVHDGFGNSAKLPPSRWKAMIEEIQRSPNQPMTFRTGIALYPFKLEPRKAPLQVYNISVGTKAELHLEWLHAWED